MSTVEIYAMEFYQPDHRTIVKEIDFWPVIDIFDDFILGRNIKQTMQNLRYDDYLMSQSFIDRLRMYKYQPMLLQTIQVEMGKRIPAFYLKEDYAIFGYVFWAIESGDNAQPIFGSAEKDEKDHSKYTVRGKKNTVVFVNPSQRENIFNLFIPSAVQRVLK